MEQNYWLARNRLARRRVLGGGATAGAGLAAMLLAGCGDDDSTSSSGPSSASTGGPSNAATAGVPTAVVQAKRGGNFNINSTTTTALDIHLESISGPQPITGAAYSRLLRYRQDSELPEPDLAAKMPEQPDQLSYVFTINEGVKFQNKAPVNGRVMTADDIVFSLNRARTPNNPLFIHGSLLDSIDKLEATDAKTVKITTKYPNAILLTTLAGSQFIVLAQETLNAFPDLKTDKATIGTGPFIVDTFNSDTGAKLSRNPDYFRKGQPYLDTLQYMKLADDWSSFLAGNLDAVTIPAERADGFKTFEDIFKASKITGGTIFRAPQPGTAIHHGMNSKAKPFDDLRVRQAMNLITDRAPQVNYAYPIGPLMSILFGYTTATAGFGLPEKEVLTFPGYRTDKRDQDVKDGLALLAQAGYTKDNPLKWDIMGWSTPHRAIGVDALQLTADMYKQVSGSVCQPTVNALDFGVWKQAEARRDFRMTSAAYAAGPDAHDTFNLWYQSKGGRNYTGFNDPQLDAMLVKEQGTFDLDQRKKLVQDMLRYVNDPSRLTSVWLGTGASTSVTSAAIKGMPDVFDFSRVDQLWRG